MGTYANAFPTAEVARVFHNVLIESGFPFGSVDCPICGKPHSKEDAHSAKVVIAWNRDVKVFQLSNSVLLHKNCLSSDSEISYLIPSPYETGDLGDSEFRTEK